MPNQLEPVLALKRIDTWVARHHPDRLPFVRPARIAGPSSGSRPNSGEGYLRISDACTPPMMDSPQAAPPYTSINGGCRSILSSLPGKTSACDMGAKFILPAATAGNF